MNQVLTKRRSADGDDAILWLVTSPSISLHLSIRDKGRSDDAQAQVDRAKSYAVDNTYKLGRAMKLQGTTSTGLKRRDLRLCVRPIFMRGLGLRRI